MSKIKFLSKFEGLHFCTKTFTRIRVHKKKLARTQEVTGRNFSHLTVTIRHFGHKIELHVVGYKQWSEDAVCEVY